MYQSTVIRLIPEPSLRTPESGLERPETALLAFGPDIKETAELGDVIARELEGEGIFYDPSPEHVPTFYRRGGDNHDLLNAREASRLITQGAWTGADIANNLLKGMSWARLENQIPGPINLEQARTIGEVVGAVYNAQHGLWDDEMDEPERRKIILQNYTVGNEQLLIRGGDAQLELSSRLVDARSSRRADISQRPKVSLPEERQETQEYAVEFPLGRLRSFGKRVTAAAAAIHL